ncbi:MAG: respiratory nitrate reductase subunit gamma [Candidatus Caenarcaniphilales bacterium]|jgi:Fe-S oxidoreductase/nitrate reductase gamma subunit|nr:respiratory nitrate reductase subunit gamma [Candidatus Caenarcaniphilales bacterium]
MEQETSLMAALPVTPTLLETRELWWNIDHNSGKVIFYLMAVIAMGIFAYGIYQKLKAIFTGKKSKENRFTNLKDRISTLLTFGLLHKKTSEKRTPGIAHALVFFSFISLWIVTDIIALQEHVFKTIYFFQGTFYKIVSFVADIAGFCLFIGILIFTLRRYLFKSKHVDNTQNDWIQPLFLLLFVITGFALEAFRLAATKTTEPYAPVGSALAWFFSYMTVEDLKSSHRLIWWFHGILTFAFIALIPYTKFIHIIMSPVTMFFRSDRHRGQLSTPYFLMDMMEAEAEGKEINEEDFTAGVFTYNDLSWKSLLDSEACTSCGRCHVVCPAQNTDKPLSPKFLMLDIRNLAHNEDRENIYAHISQETLWSCTTCNSCVEQCPVLIEHVDTIIDMRRGLLQSNMAPANLQATLKNLRTKSNPWGLDPNDREKWIQELQQESGVAVKLAKENKGNFEYLLWVGSPGAFDDRNKKVTKALAQLLTKAGVSFAVLGNEEKTSGDLARRAGDEGLYQEIVLENLEIFNKYNVKKVITQCPHVYNTLKNEYPEFGFAGAEVFHHTEILAKLILDSKLQPEKSVEDVITYHDPCYLGRYNRVFDAPRFILESIPGLKIKHIENEKTKSTCCGGGGAQMWYETPGNYINVMRLEELNEHNPSKISVACPYCSIMISTATTTAFPGTNAPEVEDIAITLAKAVL